MIKKELIKRLVIGSANFTQKYGAHKTILNQKEINKITDLAKKNNIKKIDTAESYFKFNKNLIKIDKSFKFITKVRPDRKWLSLDYCQQKIEEHFNMLNTKKVECILIHDAEILFSTNGIKIFHNLEDLKKKYYNKIGISIYDTNTLNYLTHNFNISVIQCPYNILDKRILTTGWFDKLKKKGIETHVRSIFLQGLLVNKLVYKKKYFKKWRDVFRNWFLFLEDKKISAVDYCLSDILRNDFDKIVIGVNNYSNLNEIINFKKIKYLNKIFNFKKNDLNLIDPRNWK